MTEFIGTAEAAAILSKRFGTYSSVSVRKLCQQGKIPGAQKIGRDWIVPRIWAETHEKTRI